MPAIESLFHGKGYAVDVGMYVPTFSVHPLGSIGTDWCRSYMRCCLENAQQPGHGPIITVGELAITIRAI